MAIMTPSRHMEIPMLATVRMVRRRLRQQFLRTRGRYRNIAAPDYDSSTLAVAAAGTARLATNRRFGGRAAGLLGTGGVSHVPRLRRGGEEFRLSRKVRQAHKLPSRDRRVDIELPYEVASEHASPICNEGAGDSLQATGAALLRQHSLAAGSGTGFAGRRGGPMATAGPLRLAAAPLGGSRHLPKD